MIVIKLLMMTMKEHFSTNYLLKFKIKFISNFCLDNSSSTSKSSSWLLIIAHKVTVLPQIFEQMEYFFSSTKTYHAQNIEILC